MSDSMAWISPASMDSSSIEPPASSTALLGSSSSTCSTPSAARMAIVFPSSSLAMGLLFWFPMVLPAQRGPKRVLARHHQTVTATARLGDGSNGYPGVGSTRARRANRPRTWKRPEARKRPSGPDPALGELRPVPAQPHLGDHRHPR